MTRLICITAFVAAVTACTPAPAAPPLITGIARARDGDSLEVGQRQVRLFGIDAPEFDQTCKRDGKVWECGEAAADALAKLVTGRNIVCSPVDTDEYDRAVARCRVDGKDINASMVESGYAIAYRRYSTDYVAAEQRAKASKRGLWSGTFVRPGDYREATRVQDPALGINSAGRRSAPPQSAQASPGGCLIKGNRGSNGWIYHLPGMPYYERTKAEQMFCSEAEAQDAGYRRAKVR